MEKTYKAFLIILIVSTASFLAFYNVNQGYWWDEAVYLGLANNLYRGKGYWINVINQESFRPPAFPYLTASIWQVFGVSEPLVKFLPPLFGILSVVLIFFFTKRLYSKEIALWAVLGLGTAHMFLFYGEKFLTETMFVFLSLMSLYAYYVGMEDNKKSYLLVAGVFAAFAFLTRYAGCLLVLVYIIYPIFRKTKKGLGVGKQIKVSVLSILKNWGFWGMIVLFLLILVPWFQFNIGVFGSPIGAMRTGLGTVTSSWYIADWYYYFMHWNEVFGLIGLFMIPGFLAVALKRTNSNNLIFLITVISFLFFMFLPRKELRYLIHFFQVYFVLIGVGIYEFRKWIKSKMVLPIVAVLFCLLNFLAGVQMVQADAITGTSLKEAGVWLKANAPEGSKIMSNNIPLLFYTSEHEIVYFPDKLENLSTVIENQSVSYLVIEKREPSYPDYVWRIEDWEKYPSSVFDNFELVREFKEYDRVIVFVYKV